MVARMVGNYRERIRPMMVFKVDMNTVKLKVFAILSVLMFIFAIPAHAEIVTIWGEGRHIMGDNDTKDDARKLALLRAKTMCLEKAGTYLETETIVKDLQLAKDEIKAYAAGIVKVEVVDEQISLIGETMCVTVKVKADIDTSQLDERTKQLGKDQKILTEFKKMQADIERLTKQVSELQRQKVVTENDLLGLWKYETICHPCKSKKAIGRIYITAHGTNLIIKGHITYSDGSEFNWVESAYTDGKTIWAYCKNDYGDVGIHIYNIINEERLESSWLMSNGTYGKSISIKY